MRIVLGFMKRSKSNEKAPSKAKGKGKAPSKGKGKEKYVGVPDEYPSEDESDVDLFKDELPITDLDDSFRLVILRRKLLRTSI